MEKKIHYGTSVSLKCHAIAPIDDGPFASVLYSSDNASYRFQINNLFRAKFCVVVDAVPACCLDLVNKG